VEKVEKQEESVKQKRHQSKVELAEVGNCEENDDATGDEADESDDDEDDAHENDIENASSKRSSIGLGEFRERITGSVLALNFYCATGHHSHDTA